MGWLVPAGTNHPFTENLNLVASYLQNIDETDKLLVQEKGDFFLWIFRIKS